MKPPPSNKGYCFPCDPLFSALMSKRAISSTKSFKPNAGRQPRAALSRVGCTALFGSGRTVKLSDGSTFQT
jgi:hypothetical protein